MTKVQKTKRYDLEDRTLKYSKDVRLFCKFLPKSIQNNEDSKQLVRASGSVGANYIEANESLSKKDFVLRIKISRKESKEARYWLRLVDTGSRRELELKRVELINESTELMKIFSSIMRKSV